MVHLYKIKVGWAGNRRELAMIYFGKASANRGLTRIKTSSKYYEIDRVGFANPRIFKVK